MLQDGNMLQCRYPDYILTDSGLQYKDLRDGSGDTASNGSHVTIDWDGYTLGYYGRPFEARNKVPCNKPFATSCFLYLCISSQQSLSTTHQGQQSTALCARFAAVVCASIQLVLVEFVASHNYLCFLILLSLDSCLCLCAVQGRSLRGRHQGLPQVHCGRSLGEHLQVKLYVIT